MPPAPRAGAPVDLTGTWVSVVTEDWQWRMRTPPKGDYATVGALMTPEARRARHAGLEAGRNRDAEAGVRVSGEGR